MSIRHKTIRFLHHHPVAQALIVFGFWILGEAIVRQSGIPLPGGIVGLALLLALLVMRQISTLSMRQGAGWFLSDMLLFFVPAVLAVLDHPELMGLTGLKVLFVILTGTLVVMVATAFTVDFCWQRLGPAVERNHD